jgi:hypothetical protein
MRCVRSGCSAGILTLARMGFPLRRPRGEVVRKWGPRMVCCLVPQPRREVGVDQENTQMGAGCLVPQPRGEAGSDQENTQMGAGTAVGRILVCPGNSAHMATAVRGSAFRIGWLAPLVASCARQARCSMGETLFPRVACIPVPMSRVSLLLLESDLWPPCSWVATRDSRAPCWESPPAVPPVWLSAPALVSIVGCCPPLSA